MLYNSEQGHNAVEADKNICCVKSEGAVDHSIVTRWLKKCHSTCKTPNNQARSDRPKTMNSKP